VQVLLAFKNKRAVDKDETVSHTLTRTMDWTTKSGKNERGETKNGA
jgi:hypothetical protein